MLFGLYNLVGLAVKSSKEQDVMMHQEPCSSQVKKDFSRGVTVFPDLYNITNPKYMDLTEVVSRIRNGNSGDLIERIRAGETGLKRELPCICFSGIFTQRSGIGLIKHSGLICLEYDNLPDVISFKDRICKNLFTHVAFISPSGKGLKVIVRISGNHTEAVRSLRKFFQSDNLDINPDVSAICFESWDPSIYYNQQSLIYTP